MAIAQIYTGRPNDILPAITQSDASEHEPGNLEDVGLDFLTTSARLGDSASMAYIAEAFDTGLNLGSDREQSYSQVIFLDPAVVQVAYLQALSFLIAGT